MFGNLQAANDAISAHAQAVSTQSVISDEVRLFPEEAALFRFPGGPKEPWIFHIHRGSPIDRRWDSITCLGDGCSACVAAAAEFQPGGKRRVQRRSPIAAFTVFSARPALLGQGARADGSSFNRRTAVHTHQGGYHLLWDKNQQRAIPAPGGIHPDWNTCEKQVEGLQIWKAALGERANNAIQILRLHSELQQLCMCSKTVGQGMNAGPARVIVSQYTCAQCGAAVRYDPITRQPITCHACRYTGDPDTYLTCTAECGKPTRGGIDKAYIKVVRGSQYGYGYTALPFSEIEPTFHSLIYKQGPHGPEVMCFDFEKLYAASEAAVSTFLQARGIGLATSAQVPPGYGNSPFAPPAAAQGWGSPTPQPPVPSNWPSPQSYPTQAPAVPAPFNPAQQQGAPGPFLPQGPTAQPPVPRVPPPPSAPAPSFGFPDRLPF